MLDEAHGAWRGEDDGGSLGRLGVQRARHGWTDDISTRDVCYQLLLSPDFLPIFVNFYRFLGSIWNSSSHDNPFCGASHGLPRLLPHATPAPGTAGYPGQSFNPDAAHGMLHLIKRRVVVHS